MRSFSRKPFNGSMEEGKIDLVRKMEDIYVCCVKIAFYNTMKQTEFGWGDDDKTGTLRVGSGGLGWWWW